MTSLKLASLIGRRIAKNFRARSCRLEEERTDLSEISTAIRHEEECEKIASSLLVNESRRATSDDAGCEILSLPPRAN